MFYETKKVIIFLVVGVILSITSFLCYCLIEPTNWMLVIGLCVLDFIYCFFNAYFVTIEFGYSDKKWLGASCLSLGYITIFNVVPIGYLLLNGLFGRIVEIWKDVLVLSFFTGPCLIIILIIIMLIMRLYGYVNKTL